MPTRAHFFSPFLTPSPSMSFHLFLALLFCQLYSQAGFPQWNKMATAALDIFSIGLVPTGKRVYFLKSSNESPSSEIHWAMCLYQNQDFGQEMGCSDGQVWVLGPPLIRSQPT